VAQAGAEILVLTDARQRLAVDAVRELAANFADPAVGAVSGELHLDEDSPSAVGQGVGLYWTYEKWIRQAESRLDSSVGVTGAIYAVRRSLFRALDPRTILDDVAVPMSAVLAGYRVVFEPGARAMDSVAESPAREYRRKVRTLAGNYQLLRLEPALLLPWRNRLFWQFVSHKVSRLAVPWCLLVLLAASAVLARERAAYAVAFALQAGFYLLAALGWAMSRFYRPLPFLSLPYTFALLNVAAALGLIRLLRGTETSAWKEASR
jgi:cellulose synthase/poly-beta-1,6-N-acetylglucosamine synthase-like glycosyltransferase